MSEQLRRLAKGIDIVVGTPGRVLDHIRRGTMKLENVRYLVLDEADEMLNMGFVEDVEEIMSHTSDERRVLLFSATMPERIIRLSKPTCATRRSCAWNTSKSRPTSRNKSISRYARPTSSTP